MKEISMNSPRLLTVQEAGDRLGLKKSAVYNLIAANAIPVVRTSRGGHGYAFHPEVLEAWIREGGVKPSVDGVTVSSGNTFGE
jgi:excisionase family DNA binding protein